MQAPASLFQRAGRSVLGRSEYVIVLAMTLLLAFLIVYPLAALVVRGTELADVGLLQFLSDAKRALSGPRVSAAMWHTLTIGLSVAVLSTVLGLTLGWLVGRTDMPGRSLFSTLNLVPFFMSPFIGALGWSLLGGPNAGLINRWLRPIVGTSVINIYTLSGMILVLTLFYTPYVYLFVVGAFQRMNIEMEEAASAHGGSMWRTLRHVTIPLLAPPLLSGFAMAFISSAGILDVPLVLGVPAGIHTIPTHIYELLQFPPDFKAASVIGLVQLAASIVVFVTLARIERRRSYVTITARGYKPNPVKLGKGRAVAVAVQVIYLALAVVMPVAALVMASLQSFWAGTFSKALFTWSNYPYVLFQYPLFKRALVNSLFLSIGGALIGVGLAVMVSYLAHRLPSGRIGQFLEGIVTSPIGFPGIIFSLGILVAWINSPLYGTIWILLMAYVLRFLPFSLRISTSGLLSLHRELEESVRTSGGGFLATIRYVVLPLLRPSLLAAGLLLAIIFIRELSVSALLWQPGTEVLSIALLIASREQVMPRVAAFAVIQIMMMLVLVASLIKLGGKDALSE